MTTTATAAVIPQGGGAFTLDRVEIESPGTGEVLVRLVAAGLCHTDLEVVAGTIPLPLPGIAGHEGAGIVEAVGPDVDGVAVGDKVLMSFTSCGECASCASEHPAYCETWLPRNLLGGLRSDDSGRVLRDGEPLGAHFFGQSAFSQYAIADARGLVVVDADADLTVLAPLGCAVLAGFGSMENVLDPGPGDIVAVYGTGAVGLPALIAASLRSPSILIGIDVVDERLSLARELGATHTIDARTEDVNARIAEITRGAGVRLSLDTTGDPAVASRALGAASTRGTVMVCGTSPAGTEIGVDMQGLLAGKVLRGVSLGDEVPSELIPRLIRLHRDGLLPLEKLERHYRFEDIQSAADDMRHGRTVKPVILF